jgi:hypothetical protein
VKSPKMVKYKDLTPKNQKFLRELFRRRDLEARESLIKSHGLQTADDCYWTNLDYINNYKINPDLYFEICPVCGATDREMTVLSDKMAGDGLSRSITCRCKCGEMLSYYG